jgi:hypothetical protein
MNNKIFWVFGISLAIGLTLGSISSAVFVLLNLGINNSGDALPTQESNSVATYVAQTIEADITQQAAVATPTYTSEAAATDTPTQSPTQEPFTPTNTSVPPTMIPPTVTPISTICDDAQFVRDLSVEDYSLISPGASFVKTWRLKNVGHCSWNTDYMLVFDSGNAMDAKLSIPLPKYVAPNQTVDLSVNLRAPKIEGAYRGDWKLSNSSGTRFGVGPNGDQSFWVQIQVKNLVNPNLVYDFAANSCRAEWRTGSGPIPCLGTTDGSEGFVILLDNPNLENRQENELALWTHPNSSSSGWISGMYPEFVIQPNHHFKAWVGCLDNSKGCNIVFRLDFQNLDNGNFRTLGSWQEIYDGEITKIDLDLSPHAGKRVRFILLVEVNGDNPANADAFWFVPGIVQSQSPTPTHIPSTATDVPTPTPTITQTPTETPLPTQAPTATATNEN